MRLVGPPYEFYSYCLLPKATESRIVNQLETHIRRIQRSGSETKHRFFIPFGDSDVLLEISGGDCAAFNPKLDDVRFANSIRAFPVEWTPACTGEGSPLHSLVFLKLNEDIDFADRYIALSTHLSTFESSHPDLLRRFASIQLMACLGWNEFVILIAFSAFEDLSRFLWTFSLAPAEILNRSGGKRVSLFHSSSALVLVQCTALDGRVIETNPFPDSHISGNILVDVRPGPDIERVVHALREMGYGDPHFVLGTDDLQVSFEGRPVGEVFHKVMNLRYDLKDCIYGTRTKLRLVLPEHSDAPGSAPPLAVSGLV